MWSSRFVRRRRGPLGRKSGEQGGDGGDVADCNPRD